MTPDLDTINLTVQAGVHLFMCTHSYNYTQNSL